MPKGVPAKKKKAKNGYEFPDPLPAGEILKDVGKKEWRLGVSIGKGGFGEIYAAQEAGSKLKSYPYAIKIEPSENGPLFVERSFYINVCKPEKIEEWKKTKGLNILGVPSLQGFGSHFHNDKKYRFVVMDRFGKDLWSTFLENNKVLPPKASFTYAIEILDALEYIHSIGYVHSDVKGANLLFGFIKGTENNLFLVDFGLACKYSKDKEFKRDPKKAHNGTIEYTSRDLHQGVATRRGDLEILGFNLLHWLNSTLPWEKHLTDPEKVFQSKNDLMSSIKTKLATFAPKIHPVIIDYLVYVSHLDHLEEPDYDKCRRMFQKAISQLPDSKATKTTTPKKTKATGKRTRKIVEQEDEPMEVDDCLNGDELNGLVNESPPKKSAIEKPSWKDAPLCDPGVIAVASKKTTKVRKTDTASASKSAKKADSAKPSWRDCPTIKASGVEIAGTYTRKNAKLKK